jgi:hypothetical protein
VKEVNDLRCHLTRVVCRFWETLKLEFTQISIANRPFGLHAFDHQANGMFSKQKISWFQRNFFGSTWNRNNSLAECGVEESVHWQFTIQATVIIRQAFEAKGPG